MKIMPLKAVEDVARSFPVFVELRPHLSDQESFVKQVLNQQKEGYEIIALINEEEVISCIGLRIMTMLAWGKILYIDDLITGTKNRGKGYGKILLDYVINIAKGERCEQIHLDTGYARHAAHRIYLKEGFEFHCHHLAKKI